MQNHNIKVWLFFFFKKKKKSNIQTSKKNTTRTPTTSPLNSILSEEPFSQQRDDINAEQANLLSNSNESVLPRKCDRFQLLHQPYPMLMQRDRLPLAYSMPMSPHDNPLVKSKSLSPLESIAQKRPIANYFVNDAMYLARSRSTSLTLKPITTINNHVMQTGEDSSQSSLNLSASSGYLSGSSSANSSNLNLSGRSSSSSMYVVIYINLIVSFFYEPYLRHIDSVFQMNFLLWFSLESICFDFSLFCFLFFCPCVCNSYRNGATTHHITNGVLTIHSNGSHVNGDTNHVFYDKSSIINGYVDKRNGNTSNGTHHLQQSPPQAVQQQTPAAQATNSRRRTISSNSNG